MKTISIGEVLWDVVGHEEHLGGATFNFSVHLARLGHTVSFISAIGADERGTRVLERMAQIGLTTRYVSRVADQATGAVTVTIHEGGQPHFILHRPAAYDFPQLIDEQFRELQSQGADWIYFGTLLHISSQAKRLTWRLLDSFPGARHFYDVNLRTGAYDAALVRELLARATVVKVNDDEVRELDRMFGERHSSLEDFCRGYASKLGLHAICVTRGSQGCALLAGNEYVEAEGYSIEVADTVGAGDAFAAAFLHGLSNGWPAPRIADFANRVGALVASQAGAIPPWTMQEAEALQHKSDRRESA